MRIEICGNIASGKTTLANSLSACGITSVEENFLRNPFIEAFYENPEFYSFETEVTFLLQHYHSIKRLNTNKLVSCDFSITLDLAYADVTLTQNRRKIFIEICSELEHEIGRPSKIVHLSCPEKILISRIQRRCRHFEASISIDYLTELTKAINFRIAEASKYSEIISIDSHKNNFVHSVESIPPLHALCLQT
jgi:deoxyadenosine/deoxycytidine kinase